MGGYESATHINRHRDRLDLIAITQHDRQVRHDYGLLRRMGMFTARDAARWHLIDKGGHYDFSSLEPMLDAASEIGMQVIWDLCHYGWPDDLDIFAPAFVDRFARFSGAVARLVASYSDEVPLYTLINEISFLPWAVGRKFMYPFVSGRDDEIKCQLVRAAIAGTEAILDVDRRARFIYVDPVVHVVAPREKPELAQEAAIYRSAQWEAWDMIAGRARPELGGGPRYLDVIGVNYYYSNQWEHCGKRLRWEDTPRDERMVPFRKLLTEVYERYRRPMFLAETSHYREGRPAWIREVSSEVHAARLAGVPVEGICLYPVIDRPDWEDPNDWHKAGLWDIVRDENGILQRVLNEEYAAAIREAQKILY
jgi:UDP-galactopyranose mutase